jgi:multisubunit Na+/H+ antiporter MnhG subunit
MDIFWELKELIRLNRAKFLLDLVLAAIYLSVVLGIPSFGFASKFSGLNILQLVTAIGISFILVGAIYYPLACGLWGIARSVKKPVNRSLLLISIIFVLIFNPISYHFISKLFISNNASVPQYTKENGCGLIVVDFSDFSKAPSSGMGINDIVYSIDGLKINDVNDLVVIIQSKQPGSRIDLGTNRGNVGVEIVKDNSNKPALGVKFKEIGCE